jgi:hypothetical protein
MERCKTIEVFTRDGSSMHINVKEIRLVTERQQMGAQDFV